MVERAIEPILLDLSRRYPAVTITGPRQSGRTTLCRKAFPKRKYANLEAPDVRRFATEDPHGFLAAYSGGAILDEIQRLPELPSYIQEIIDAEKERGRFILTGRMALLKLLPFSLGELKQTQFPGNIDRLLLTGFYPRIHDQGLNPTQALRDYLETYVERDLRQFAAVREDRVLSSPANRQCFCRVGLHYAQCLPNRFRQEGRQKMPDPVCLFPLGCPTAGRAHGNSRGCDRNMQ
jgi:uncharacterized protein